MYLIFDGRAVLDLGDALVLDTADTLEEAREAARVQGEGAIFKMRGDKVDQSDFVEYIDAEQEAI